MTICIYLKRIGARAECLSLHNIEHATRNLQRRTPLSRINHIRVELGIFEKELKE
jgi:hypothetical protein